MNAQDLRKKLWSLSIDDRAIVSSTAIDELLYRTGSGVHEIDHEAIIEIVTGSIKAREKMKGEKDERILAKSGA